MTIFLSCLIFAAGIVLVVKGGDEFVDAASWLARAFGIPSFLIGATIVSLATTMPELLVSAIAAGEGKADMAVGNAVGSVTANLGLILAVAMLCMHAPCPRRQYGRNCALLAVVAAVLLASCRGGSLSVPGSVLLFASFLFFMAANVRSARREMGASSERQKVPGKTLALKLTIFVLSAAAIVLGSRLMVNSGSDLAREFGVPERIIAVTLVAVGTSLPELVTTITAIIKHESALSVGNIIGANIIDLSMILPICSLVAGKPLPVSAQSLRLDIPVCLAFTLMAVVPFLVRQKASKWQGALLLLGYGAYLVAVL